MDIWSRQLTFRIWPDFNDFSSYRVSNQTSDSDWIPDTMGPLVLQASIKESTVSISNSLTASLWQVAGHLTDTSY